MTRRLKQAVVVLVVLFATAQLVRPDRTNPPIVASRTLESHVGTGSALPAILNRACSDCHSNATVWPWYTQVAPLSWLMARAVAEGRQTVNFSEWGGYSPDQRGMRLAASCDAVSTGRMPGLWTRFRPDTQLSPQEIETICVAARQADKQTAKASQ